MAYPSLSWSNIPKRFNIAVMLFLACLISFMVDVILSISLVAMVNPTDPNSTAVLPDYGPRYNWSQIDQGQLLGAFFYGYVITSLPAGMLAENFGGKAMVGYACFCAALITALTPSAAYSGKWAVWILRFSIGFFAGFIYPACYNLISKWAPPIERGKFMFVLAGNMFGIMITWPISGVIIKNLGWDWVFYLVSLFVLTFSGIWFWIVEDSPAKHTTISLKEREMIEESLGNNITYNKGFPPFRCLLSSAPLWGLMFLHFGNMWGLYFLLTATPKFLSEVLGFNVTSASFLSSLPHLARLICSFGFGTLDDLIRRRNLMSLTRVRKVFCLSSHILPGILLITLAFFGRDPYICVALITISLGFNGATVATNAPNAQDLTPNYAATLYGIIDGIGTTAGIFSPMIVSAFTAKKNTLDEWFWIFLIGAGVYILPAILFWFIGSGKIQKWNESAVQQETAITRL